MTPFIKKSSSKSVKPFLSYAETDARKFIFILFKIRKSIKIFVLFSFEFNTHRLNYLQKLRLLTKQTVVSTTTLLLNQLFSNTQFFGSNQNDDCYISTLFYYGPAYTRDVINMNVEQRGLCSFEGVKIFEYGRTIICKGLFESKNKLYKVRCSLKFKLILWSM